MEDEKREDVKEESGGDNENKETEEDWKERRDQ